VTGLLVKEANRFRLTPDSAMFLDRRSPAYLGSIVDFLAAPEQMASFQDVAAVVRRGGTVKEGGGHLAPEHPIWVNFARAMAPLMAMPAEAIAGLLSGEQDEIRSVLDMAAGHGLFGLTLAKRFPEAVIHALDWPNVLEVAKENAAKAGLTDRLRILPGSAFEQDYGTGHDVVLLTNFLHHFDVETCEILLAKVHAALRSGGRAVALEFVPNEDRISPPSSAMFAFMMLGTTPQGDAYTFTEYEAMFRRSGFERVTLHAIPPSEQRVLMARKP